MSKFLKTFLAHCISSDEIYSHRKDPSGQQKRLSVVLLLLLKACSGVLAPIEEIHPVSGLRVDFAEREQTVQLNGPLTRGDCEG